MKYKHLLGMLTTLLFILSNQTIWPVMAQTPAGNRLNLLSSDEGDIVLELTVVDFQLETVDYAGETYHRIKMPDMAQTATPNAISTIPQVFRAEIDSLRNAQLATGTMR